MKDADIKKYWLLTLILQMVLSVLTIVIAVSYLRSAPVFTEALAQTESKFLEKSLLSIIGGLLSAVILYVCAYRKPGTAFLSFNLICFFFWLPFVVYTWIELYKTRLMVGHLSPSEETYALISFITAVQVGTGISALVAFIWFYLCFKLRQVNKRIQISRILQMESYQLSVQQLRSVCNADDLKTCYAQAVHKHPEIAWYLKKLYKERKRELCLQA